MRPRPGPRSPVRVPRSPPVPRRWEKPRFPVLALGEGNCNPPPSPSTGDEASFPAEGVEGEGEGGGEGEDEDEDEDEGEGKLWGLAEYLDRVAIYLNLDPPLRPYPWPRVFVSTVMSPPREKGLLQVPRYSSSASPVD